MSNENTFLTTYDNKFNPFEDFMAWFKEDIRLGHFTSSFLAEEANISDIFSDEMNEKFIEEAMKRIVDTAPTIWKIVTPKDYS